VSEPLHDVGGVFHHAGQEGRLNGPDSVRRSYASFASFNDPDGNGWLLREASSSWPCSRWPFYCIAFAKGTALLLSSVAGMLSGAIPLFTFVTALAFLRQEPINVRSVGGTLLGFLGILLIARPWSQNIGGVDIAGAVWMVAGSSSMGASSLVAVSGCWVEGDEHRRSAFSLDGNRRLGTAQRTPSKTN
jgi:hypothetical protein